MLLEAVQPMSLPRATTPQRPAVYFKTDPSVPSVGALHFNMDCSTDTVAALFEACAAVLQQPAARLELFTSTGAAVELAEDGQRTLTAVHPRCRFAVRVKRAPGLDDDDTVAGTPFTLGGGPTRAGAGAGAGSGAGAGGGNGSGSGAGAGAGQVPHFSGGALAGGTPAGGEAWPTVTASASTSTRVGAKSSTPPPSSSTGKAKATPLPQATVVDGGTAAVTPAPDAPRASNPVLWLVVGLLLGGVAGAAACSVSSARRAARR